MMSLKELMRKIKGGTWRINEVLQGSDGYIRIDAESKFYKSGAENYFSKWFARKYVNQVRSEIGMKPIKITRY